MKKLVLLTILLMGCYSQNAIAQGVDEEEKFDVAISQFGYVSGKVLQCADAKQTANVEKNSLKVFTEIARLFGTERAFFYASAYGAGAKENIDRSQCPQYLRQFQEAINKSPLQKVD